MDDLIYLSLRFARRQLSRLAFLESLEPLIIGAASNSGEKSPEHTVNRYENYFTEAGLSWLDEKTILEVGIGRTNGACYELASRGALKCYAYEPFRPLQASLDRAQLEDACKRHGTDPDAIRERVLRITATSGLEDGAADVIVSTSVLEHVSDLDALGAELDRVLKPGGFMLHVVDYRDHFFRYPYHHLLWPDEIWDRHLNPGDLPRWRIRDHLRAFRRRKLEVTLLRASAIEPAYQKIKHRIHPRFGSYSEFDLKTAFGVLLCKKSHR